MAQEFDVARGARRALAATQDFDGAAALRQCRSGGKVVSDLSGIPARLRSAC
jgi:hypothetical protein